MGYSRISQYVWLGPLLALWLSGCGTTRWTDTKRTATEQMLVSDAIDRAVSRIDFRLLAGKEVFLDTSFLGEAVDKEYLTSTLRQEMVSSGCILKEKREQAAFIVEARAGTIGTDRHDLLFGVPGFSLPTFSSPVPGPPALPSTFPEVAVAKRTDQQAVAKIAVFAYHRETGAPVWQSGADVVASKARDLWVLGAGPFHAARSTTTLSSRAMRSTCRWSMGINRPKAPLRRCAFSQQRLFNMPEKFPTQIAATPAPVDPTPQLLPQPFAPDYHLHPPLAGQPPTMEPAWDKVEVAAPLKLDKLK